VLSILSSNFFSCVFNISQVFVSLFSIFLVKFSFSILTHKSFIIFSTSTKLAIFLLLSVVTGIASFLKIFFTSGVVIFGLYVFNIVTSHTTCGVAILVQFRLLYPLFRYVEYIHTHGADTSTLSQ
jgi:hypothetical protein